ncbi:AAA family ATPase [Planococcus sp. APC 4015]|nr:AAA family ATPase [Planococcus sp. APC 4015]
MPDSIVSASGSGAWLKLRRGDRTVVDKAGMVELRTTAALVDLALREQLGVPIVCDSFQALQVGHAEEMASAVRFSAALAELDTVHRVSDPRATAAG